MHTERYLRGDIYLCGANGARRPALIVSNNAANAHASIVSIIPISKRVGEACPAGVPIHAGRLDASSEAHAGRVMPACKDSLYKYIGNIRGTGCERAVNDALRSALGLSAHGQGDGMYQRGDIFMVSLGKGEGSIQGGARPAVIVSDSQRDGSGRYMIVVPLTTKAKRPLPVHAQAEGHGLTSPSTMLAEQAVQIGRERLRRRIGSISGTAYEEALNHALEVQFGI